MKKLFGFLATLPVLAFGLTAFAAVDPDIASNSLAMVSSAKENIFGVISANIGTITLIFVGLLAVFLVLRLIRRAVGSR